MTFLKDYPTWDHLCAQFPDMRAVQEGIVKTRLFESAMPGSLSSLLVAAGVQRATCDLLASRYTEQGVRYGLATLLGIGKGRNNLLQQVGPVICKYSDLYARDMQDPEFLAAIKTSAYAARAAIIQVNCEFLRVEIQEGGNKDLIKACLYYHFGFDKYADSNRHEMRGHLNTIKRHFRTLYGALTGGFRIAAQHDADQTDRRSYGYVQQVSRTRPENSLASPNKTYATEHYDYGSIHVDYDLFRFKKSGWNRNFLACVIIHEASHKWCRTQDNSYIDDASYKRQTADLKVENADSYAFFAMSIAKGSIITSDNEPWFKTG
jgi:hypothetical protein